jgi:hypothetical protein
MKEGVPVSEDAVENAERRSPAAHDHGDAGAPASLSQHLRQAHDFVAPDHLSDAAIEGLHDRFHSRRHAADR